MIAAFFLFWFCFGALVHSYCLYPLFLACCAPLFGKQWRVDSSFTPSVVIVVPAYNEANVIQKKIENILALDYPADKISIWIGSDCSTDTTNDIVNACTDTDTRVHLWIAPDRGGKTQIINRLLPTLTAEIVLLTDANTMHQPGSLRRLVSNFADPAIGAVAGHIEHSNSRESAELWYRNFEVIQKQNESRLHSSISAFGGFYAIRLALFVPLPVNAYSNDDVLIPMNIIRQGFRVAFERSAISTEDFRPDIAEEFRRRIRIGAGNFQSFFWLLDFLNPLRGWPWFCYVSHKAIRWFSPLLMVGAGIATAMLAIQPGHGRVYALLLLAEVGTLAVGLSYKIIPLKALRPLYYFIMMNSALIGGLGRFLRGIKHAAWQPTQRK